jgi:hypothetical protein
MPSQRRARWPGGPKLRLVRDRRRERDARARGDDFRRYTWGDVFEEPLETVAELRALLVRYEA